MRLPPFGFGRLSWQIIAFHQNPEHGDTCNVSPSLRPWLPAVRAVKTYQRLLQKSDMKWAHLSYLLLEHIRQTLDGSFLDMWPFLSRAVNRQNCQHLSQRYRLFDCLIAVGMHRFKPQRGHNIYFKNVSCRWTWKFKSLQHTQTSLALDFYFYTAVFVHEGLAAELSSLFLSKQKPIQVGQLLLFALTVTAICVITVRNTWVFNHKSRIWKYIQAYSTFTCIC